MEASNGVLVDVEQRLKKNTGCQRLAPVADHFPVAATSEPRSLAGL